MAAYIAGDVTRPPLIRAFAEPAAPTALRKGVELEGPAGGEGPAAPWPAESDDAAGDEDGAGEAASEGGEEPWPGPPNAEGEVPLPVSPKVHSEEPWLVPPHASGREPWPASPRGSGEEPWPASPNATGGRRPSTVSFDVHTRGGEEEDSGRQRVRSLRRMASWKSTDSLGDDLSSCALPRYLVVYSVYLVVVIVVGTVALCLADPGGISPVDGLFLAVSAMSMTGLSPVDFPNRPASVHGIVWSLMVCGSPMLLSSVPVVLRRLHALHQKRKEDKHPRPPTFWSISNSAREDATALTSIYRTVFLYWLCGQLIGWVVLWSILDGSKGQLGGVWDAAFLASSAWHNCGLTTLPALPLANSPEAPWLLSTVMVLILCGNTCFPMAFRVLIWIRMRCTRDKHKRWVLRMLLKHPRNCYTHLFPYRQTMWLAMVTVALVVAQIAALCVVEMWAEPASNAGESDMLAGLTGGERMLATIFHAVSTRTAGFQVLNLAKLSPTAAFVFMVCMWISTCPLVIAMRSTAPSEAETSTGEDAPWRSVIGTQLSAFMGENTLFLVVLFFAILLAEEYAAASLTVRDTRFLFICFEFCSAYGTSGLSMSSAAWSHSGEWSPVAKLCLVVVMYMGRLRGLPEAIDPAVRLRMVAIVDTPRLEDELSEAPERGEDDMESLGSPAMSPRRTHRSSDEESLNSRKSSKEEGGDPFVAPPRGPPAILTWRGSRRRGPRGRSRANSI